MEIEIHLIAQSYKVVQIGLGNHSLTSRKIHRKNVKEHKIKILSEVCDSPLLVKCTDFLNQDVAVKHTQ